MNDVIEIINSLEDSGVLTDRATEKVKNEYKQTKRLIS